MGWWKIKDSDDIMGDGPADVLLSALRFHETITGEKPTFQEVLDATANLVKYDGGLFLCDAESEAQKDIVAVFAPPAPQLSSRPIETNDLIFNLTRAFEKVAGLYLDTGHQRKPRLRELLVALSSVLRVEPEELLRDVGGVLLVDFRVKDTGLTSMSDRTIEQ